MPDVIEFFLFQKNDKDVDLWLVACYYARVVRKMEEVMDIEKLNSKLDQALSKKDKTLILENDKKFIEELKNNAAMVEKIKKLPLTVLHKAFKSSGYKSDIATLGVMLDKVGIRKKKDLKWLFGSHYYKCHVKKEDGGQCGNWVMPSNQYFIGRVGKKDLGYTRSDFYEIINKNENKENIYKEIKNILLSYKIERFFICVNCNTIYEKEKVNGKYVYKINNGVVEFMNKNYNAILDKVREVIKKYGLYVKKN